MSSFPWNNDEVQASKKATKGQVKSTCPWSTDGTKPNPVQRPRKVKPRSVCPWATDTELTVKENIIPQQRTPAPWDDVQSGAGFGGKKKKKAQSNTSLWQPTSNVDDRFSGNVKFGDHSAAIHGITQANRVARAKNGSGGNSLEGIF
jgi:hypothetical protein